VGRSYQLKRRAARQDQTRQRIIEAAIELHQTIGPAATTLSEIAERAQVGRVTVYRHFADEPTLARACSGQYFERHPFPDPERWRALSDTLGRRVTVDAVTGVAQDLDHDGALLIDVAGTVQRVIAGEIIA